MILSAGLMLDWLGEKHHDVAATSAGRRIESAVAQVIADGKTLTADLGGRAGTRAVAEAVSQALVK
jgi:3-isopropylmalate dehydrogenase